MYGIMAPKKTTIYLPDDLKKSVERLAKREKTSEATFIREAVTAAIKDRTPPAPTLPLVEYGLGAPDIAERAEEILDAGFGR